MSDAEPEEDRANQGRSDVTEDDGVAIGVDLGGTKLEVAAVDGTGRVLVSVRRPTSPERGHEAVLADVATCVREVWALEPGRTVRGVGVGVAGQVDSGAGVVTFAPNLQWRDVPLRVRLESMLGLPVRAINDVQAATYGEWAHGAGRGTDELVCLFVGTGVGGGVITRGRLLCGCSGSAGEFGHMTIDLDGPPCRCGNNGCLEAYAGGWAIARRARAAAVWAPARAAMLLDIADDGAPDASPGVSPGASPEITAQTVARAARLGDPLARELVADVGRTLGAGAASIVNAFNPCRLILGGGIIEGMPEVVAAVEEAVGRRALPSAARRVQLSVAGLGRQAGSIGAAAWMRRTLGEDAAAAWLP